MFTSCSSGSWTLLIAGMLQNEPLSEQMWGLEEMRGRGGASPVGDETWLLWLSHSRKSTAFQIPSVLLQFNEGAKSF